MEIVIDTHIHFYKNFDIEKSLNTLLEKLGSINSTAKKAAILIENESSYNIKELHKYLSENRNTINLNYELQNDYLKIQNQTSEELFLFSGQQITSIEGIEILNLFNTQKIKSLLTAKETIKEIIQINAIPAITWAPGKWFFKRGKIISQLISYFKTELLIADTSLRFKSYPKSGLMKKAEKNGCNFIYGSDPLFPKSEENSIGKYATLLTLNSNRKISSSLLIEILKNNGQNISSTGQRDSVYQVANRIFKHILKKRHTLKQSKAFQLND